MTPDIASDGTRQRLEAELAQLIERHELISRRIGALNRDVALAQDSDQRFVKQERLAEIVAEREQLQTTIVQLEHQLEVLDVSRHAAHPADPPLPTKSRVGTPAKIVLVVEDHDDWRRILVEAVERAGLHVIAADNKRRAAEILNAVSVDIAIVDLSLTDNPNAPREGLALIMQMHREYKNGRSRPVVIAVSGRDDFRTADMGAISECQRDRFVIRFLPKGLELDEKIDEALQEASNAIL